VAIPAGLARQLASSRARVTGYDASCAVIVLGKTGKEGSLDSNGLRTIAGPSSVARRL
jgi:hypothetical protein